LVYDQRSLRVTNAAPLLIAADGALVVNVSYYGAVSTTGSGLRATKAGLDKLTFDMAQDFAKPYNVAVVSIWPGPTATERSKSVIAKIPGGDKILASQETPKFSGLAIASLYSDPQLMSKSGSVVIAAKHPGYGFKDFNGKQPPSLREQKGSPRPFLRRLIFRLREPPFLDGVTKTANLKREAGMIGRFGGGLRQIRVDRLMQLREDNGQPFHNPAG